MMKSRIYYLHLFHNHLLHIWMEVFQHLNWQMVKFSTQHQTYLRGDWSDHIQCVDEIIHCLLLLQCFFIHPWRMVKVPTTKVDTELGI